MCKFLTPLFYIITTIIIDVCLQCLHGLLSQSKVGISTLIAEISSSSPVKLKALERTHFQSNLAVDYAKT